MERRSTPVSRAALSAFLVDVPVGHVSATAATGALSVRWRRAERSSGKEVPRLGLGTLRAGVPAQVGGLRSL